MRAIFARLADTSHTLPMPGLPGRLFAASGEQIDADDPFWLACLADGSIIETVPLADRIAPAITSPAPAVAITAPVLPAAVSPAPAPVTVSETSTASIKG